MFELLTAIAPDLLYQVTPAEEKRAWDRLLVLLFGEAGMSKKERDCMRGEEKREEWSTYLMQ